MNRKTLVESLSLLGSQIKGVVEGDRSVAYFDQISNAIDKAGQVNPWFEKRFVMLSLSNISRWLEKENLEKWLEGYNFDYSSPKNVAIIMAGNIPLVGFHDFLSVLVSGNNAIIKMSSKDAVLLPTLVQYLYELNTDFQNRIIFADNLLKNFDAVIATGSDNSGKYFDYYFGKYPSIIRRNRNSVAVVHKDDSVGIYELLSNDIMDYFGLGCRSVSKIYIPLGFQKEAFLDSFHNHNSLIHNYKYFNNYEYNKSILLINRVPHLDSGMLLMKEDISLVSPVAVLNYEYYDGESELEQVLKSESNKIQCILSSKWNFSGCVKPGMSQFPDLNDWADGVNVLDFLIGLKN